MQWLGRFCVRPRVSSPGLRVLSDFKRIFSDTNQEMLVFMDSFAELQDIDEQSLKYD